MRVSRQADKKLFYWAEREQKHLLSNVRSQQELDQAIKETNTKALNDCLDQLYAWYGKYADANGISITEARKAARTADIDALAKKAKEYVRTKDFSDIANAEMKLYNFAMKTSRLELLQNQLKLRMFEMTDQMERIMKEGLTAETLAALEHQMGILGISLYDTAELKNLSDYIVNTSFQGNTFSERIWQYQDEMKKELDRLLRQNIMMGKNPAQSGTAFAKLFGVQESKALRLIHTEGARVNAQATKAAYEKAGYRKMKVLPRGNACEVCLELAGETSKEPADINDPRYLPPFHPHCYCTTVPVEPEGNILSSKQLDAEFEKKWSQAENGDKTMQDYFMGLFQGKADRSVFDKKTPFRYEEKSAEDIAKSSEKAYNNLLPLDLQFFADKRSDKEKLLESFKNNKLPRGRFNKNKRLLEAAFKGGVDTMAGKVKDKEDVFYHIAYKHSKLAYKPNFVEMIKTVLKKPDIVIETMDKNGAKAISFISRSVDVDPVMVVTRYGRIVSAYDTNEQYIKKQKRKGKVIFGG